MSNSIKNYFNKTVLKRVTDAVRDESVVPSATGSTPPEKRLREEYVNDVASFCRRQLDDGEKYQLLTNAWTPDITFKFPASGDRNLKFQNSWIQSFSWLLYSPIEDGAYCRFCVAFSFSTVGKGSHQSTNAFVQTPFRQWKKAIEKCKDHQEKDYHKSAMERGANFILIYENKKNNVVCEIDTSRKKQQIENRKKISSIIRTVLLCGRQGLALRGHRDHGRLSLEMPVENDGNFRALLRFAIESGDNVLKSHIESAAENASYLSPRIQNEIIETAGQIIQKKIVDRINKSGYFSVMADETTDVSGIEQFSICVRFVEKAENDNKIREDFLCFVPVEDVTGAGLANTLLKALKDLKLNLANLRGQGYDGARAMSGEFKGCAAVIRSIYPEAVYVHCANHSLNLAISYCCKIPSIRNCIGTIKDIVNIFRLSTKAGAVLNRIIKETNPESKQTRLLKFCETRWVEHLDSLSLFYDVFECICAALEELDDTNLRSDTTKPHALLAAISTPQFIISLGVLKPIFLLTKNVSQLLQREDCDLSICVNYANDLFAELNEMRGNAEQSFKDIFDSANGKAANTGIELKVPRIVGRQINRDNYEGSPEIYYRRSIFVPFLDHFLEQITERFLRHRELLLKIESILPSKCVGLSDTQIQETVRAFEVQWPRDVCGSGEDFLAELKMWRRHNKNVTELPKTFIDGLNVCNATIFPNINKFLQIGATLPVSVASSERSFSSLRRLKTYLRNKTGEDRLNGLALLNVHRDVDVTQEEIINIMAKSGRKINMML